MEILEQLTRKTLRATIVWPALTSLLIFLGLALTGGQALQTAADLRDLNEQRRLSLRIEKRLFAAEKELLARHSGSARAALASASELAETVIGYLNVRIQKSDEALHRQLLQDLRTDLRSVRQRAELFRALPDGSLLEETPAFLNAVQQRIFQMEEVDRELHSLLTGQLDWNFRLIVGLLIALTLSFVVVIPLFTAARVKALGARFHELVEHAKAASRSKSSFLANMSHEIRSPISAIIGYTDILSNRVQEPDDQSVLRVISSNADHLLQLFNDILDFSKIESLAMSVRKAPVVLEKFLAELVSMNSARAALEGVRLEVQLSALLPEVVVTDELRLRQVILNLLTNAIKFSPEGATVTLAVSARADQPKGSDVASEGSEPRQAPGWLRIEVRDEGPGIPLADQESVFDAFTQSEQTDARKHQGTGLGLTISRRLTKLLGGRIGLESQPGQGACFWVEVPCYSLNDTKFIDVRISERHTDRVQRHSRLLDGFSGLVVDDRTDIRLMVEQFCADAGAEVDSARDGAEAIRKFRLAQRPFDFVVLDIQMPGKDGFVVFQELLSEGYLGPVLALTASASTAVQEKCLHAGFSAFLGKPVERARLIETIAGMLQPAVITSATEQTIKILLIDDDKVVVEMIRHLLSRHGHYQPLDFLLPGEIDRLLTSASRDVPDVILIDHGLGPGVRADEVIVRLRALYPEAAVIGMSADPLSELDPAFAAALDGFVEKTDLPALAHVIRRVLNALRGERSTHAGNGRSAGAEA